jgi:hypothetical protein
MAPQRIFTLTPNWDANRTCHLFQRRYKAILVDGDRYLLELARDGVLNPVRARVVSDAGDWPWSRYRVMVGVEAAPEWLVGDALLAAFAKRRSTARKPYVRFVAEWHRWSFGLERPQGPGVSGRRGLHRAQPGPREAGR